MRSDAGRSSERPAFAKLGNEQMKNALKALKSYVLPPLFSSVTASVAGAVMDLSTVAVSAAAAFGVAIWFWDRDRRSVAAAHQGHLPVS